MTDSSHASLSEAEKSIRGAVQESDAPFLGLLGESFSTEIRKAVDEAIAANPTVAGYTRWLHLYPALFATNLAWHVMRGMGESGHFSLYPYIQKALGVAATPDQRERENLWRAFRHALLALGLEPSPRTFGTHYMADEYLRQAGVPLPFVDDLAERMLTFAKKVGIPYDDDPEGITAWQTELDDRLNIPFSQTARKTLALDRQGYYTRLFLRVYTNDGQPTDNSNKLEKAISEAFQQQTTPGIKRTALPRIALNNGCLGVFFPGGDDQEWRVEVDGEKRLYRSGVEDQFIPLGHVLPSKIEVSSLNSGQKVQTTIWEDEKPNRMLFFSETGRLLGRGQLAQGPLNLPPGAYTVLSRFSPNDIETDELSDAPPLFTFTLSLRPGETRVLANGPASLEVRADSEPLIDWQGNAHASKDGVEFIFGQAGLEVEIPTDWLDIGAHYELTLMPSGAGTEKIIPLAVDAEGRSIIDLSAIAAGENWKPGLIRLLVELRRAGEKRVLSRSARLYWLGLREISRGLRFVCTHWPENLDLNCSDNVSRNGNDLTYKEAAARNVRLVFDLSEKRQQSLSWNVPGVFIEIEQPAGGGIPERVSRAIGSTESVSLTSPKQIIVIADEPGVLQLGDWSQHVDFTRRSSKVLPASFLSSRLTPQSSTLVYRNERTGNSLELLKLTQPHEVISFSSKIVNGQFEAHLQLSEPLDALSIRALNLMSDEDYVFELPANSSDWIQTRFGTARLMVVKGSNGGYAAYLYINLEYWPSGAWLFYLDAQIKGIWGHLQNNRQDMFAAGMLLSDGQVLTPRLWLGELKALEDKKALEVLARVHTAMQACYAKATWDSIAWLGDAWKTLAERWKGHEGKGLITLADLTAQRAPDDASSTWLPQTSITSTLPGLFALEAQEYRRINEKPHPLTRSLKAMASADEAYPAVFPDLLHFAAAAGFRNFAEIAIGKPPSGFKPDLYSQTLISADASENQYRINDDTWLPGPGDFLGPLHYRHAMRMLEDKYDRSLGGNEIRRGQALGMCIRFHRDRPTLDVPGTPGHYCAYSPHIMPWAYPTDDGLDDSILQRYENLSHLAHFVAWLAYACRLETRVPGTLSKFISDLPDQAHVESSLTYATQIGESLFAYYLLLWELALKADAD